MGLPLPVHLLRGHRAEKAACRFLRKQGLKLVARNYRTPYGEIDLVMDHGETLVFIEVRFRASARFGGAAETIDRGKQTRLRASAEHYIQREPGASNKACRFDIVAFDGSLDNRNLSWIQDAL